MTRSERRLNIYTISAVNGRSRINLGKKPLAGAEIIEYGVNNNMGLHTWVSSRLPYGRHVLRNFLIDKLQAMPDTATAFILDNIKCPPIIGSVITSNLLLIFLHG